MNELIITVKSQLIAQIKASSVIRVTKADLTNLIGNFRLWTESNRELTENEKKELFVELTSHYVADLNYDTDFVVLERGSTIVDNDPRIHTKWDPSDFKRFYWRKQREFLITTLSKRNGQEDASKIINSIDFETEAILRNMENPIRQSFNSKGLVVGYVQSGKTANFTALISKAADVGYRFVIVLAGIHDELRQQTQIRIDKELTGHNNLSLEGSFIEWNELEESKRWLNLTSAGWLSGMETGEFSGRGINKFKDVFLNKNRPVIAIVKKNVKILDRIIKWINQSDESDRINVPILIIDDEADQASIDGNSNKPDTDPAKTNAKIRSIINLFPRSSYVGYTATPFANVFIKHDSEHDTLGDDLYPRNFIHSLPEPNGYFGTRKIFHDSLDDFFVKVINDPKNDRKYLADSGIITDDLRSAIISFFISIVIRKFRGAEDAPMSMMINIDHRVSKMNRVGIMVKNYVTVELPKSLKEADILEIYDKYISDSETLNNKLDINNKFYDKNKIIVEVLILIKSKAVLVKTLNSGNEDKLDYAKEPSMKVIAVGGNKLSRGLTLDGLTITYYLRESKQFDTLLQMGRWFGYRKGYEDLVRIYTSKTLWKQFKDLAIVELEFREDIQEMIEDDKTPKEFAIGVTQILGLLPTAKNRLGAAELQSNYGGSQVTVKKLTLDKVAIIDHNLSHTTNLITELFSIIPKPIKAGKNKNSTLLFENISIGLVKPYINNFQIAKNTDGTYLEFNREDLIRYITKKEDTLFSKWNVAIVSISTDDDVDTIKLNGEYKIKPVNRARLKTSPINGAYNIKAVSSKTDRRIDLTPDAKNEYENRKNPLLLIYYIDKHSKPMKDDEKSHREPLYSNIDIDKHRNPVSYSIIFPPDGTSKGVYIQNI
jgi:dimeric dUTPase (all-alpha-NTP-PPase superfamily)